MEFELVDSSHIEVHPFRLGMGELVDYLGSSIPAPLDGIIAVPDTYGPHPLVVILHGVRPVDSILDDVYTRV